MEFIIDENIRGNVEHVMLALIKGENVKLADWRPLFKSVRSEAGYGVDLLRAIVLQLQESTRNKSMSDILMKGVRRDWWLIKENFFYNNAEERAKVEKYIEHYFAITSEAEPAQVFSLSDEGREELAKKVFSKDFLEYKDADGKDVYMTFIHTFENLANGKGAGKGKKGAAALLKMACDGKLKDGKTNKANLIAKGLEYGNVARHFAEAYNMYMTKDYYKSSKIDYTTAQVPPYISLREQSK